MNSVFSDMDLCNDLIKLTGLELRLKDDKTISEEDKNRLLKGIE